LKEKRVLNAAVRVVTNTGKYDRGLHYTMRHDLHWLDMTDRVQFRIATTVYRCLHGMAPEYLSELCFPVNLKPSRYQLRSLQSNQLIVPPVKLSTEWTSFVCCCWTYHLDSGTTYKSYTNICVILNFQ